MEQSEIKGKRTGIDFSKHEVLVTEKDGLLVHYLKKPNSICDSIKFVNTQGFLAVTGDYGNWMFYREFHPSATGYVSEQYWLEKLRIASTQNGEEYDPDGTRKQIEYMINGGAQEYGYIGEKLDKILSYYKDCLYYTDDEFEYKNYAYMQHPSFMDGEDVIFKTKTKPWLQTVFDGFDEICRRMKDATNSKTYPPL